MEGRGNILGAELIKNIDHSHPHMAFLNVWIVQYLEGIVDARVEGRKHACSMFYIERKECLRRLNKASIDACSVLDNHGHRLLTRPGWWGGGMGCW